MCIATLSYTAQLLVVIGVDGSYREYALHGAGGHLPGFDITTQKLRSKKELRSPQLPVKIRVLHRPQNSELVSDLKDSFTLRRWLPVAYSGFERPITVHVFQQLKQLVATHGPGMPVSDPDPVFAAQVSGYFTGIQAPQCLRCR